MKYPDNLSTTSTTISAIVRIQNVKLTPSTNGSRLTLDNVMHWVANLLKLFEDQAQAIKKVNGKEILSAGAECRLRSR